MKRKSLAFVLMVSVACLSKPTDAKVTFLPDWEEEPLNFEGGEDDNLCKRSTSPVYHYAPGNNKCPSPKIYDKTCPHSDDWITECYCPARYNQTCTSPYRGVGQICDGKYESCCDTRCREGSQSSCSYPYVLAHTSSTGCGETCYVCRYGNDCNTSCSSGEITSPSGGTNDFNGQACVTCSTPPPPPPPPAPEPDPKPETGGGGSSDPCNGVKCSDNKVCSKGSCVCPAGQCCPSCTGDKVCKSGSCVDTTAKDPCDGVKCTNGKTCSNGSCICPTNQKDCNGTCKECCKDSDCPSGKNCENGICKTAGCTENRGTCTYATNQTGGGWDCKPCTYTKADCSTGSAYSCTFTPCDQSKCPSPSSCYWKSKGVQDCVCPSGYYPKPEANGCRCRLEKSYFQCQYTAVEIDGFDANSACPAGNGFKLFGQSPCAYCIKCCGYKETGCRYY